MHRLALLTLLTVACAAPVSSQTGSAADEIRSPKPEELVGILDYGGTASVDYSDSPTYRAFRFRVNAGDDFSVQASTTAADRSVHAELVWVNPNNGGRLEQLGTGDGPSVELASSSFSDFVDLYLMVRESEMRPAPIDVKLVASGLSVPLTDVETFTPGAYASPVQLVGQTLDVPMRCKHGTGNDSSAIASLSFTTDAVSFIAGDGVLGTFDELTFKKFSQGSSTVRLRAASDASNRELLRVTNVGPRGVRVEYFSDLGNTVMCVGTARRP